MYGRQLPLGAPPEQWLPRLVVQVVVQPPPWATQARAVVVRIASAAMRAAIDTIIRCPPVGADPLIGNHNEGSVNPKKRGRRKGIR